MALSNLSAWMPTLWGQEVMRFLSYYIVLARLVNRDYENEVQQLGQVVNVPLPPTLRAQMKQRGVPVTFTEATLATTPVTMDKHIVVPVEVDDIEAAQTRPDVMENFGRAAAIALAENVEAYLLSKYADAATAVGTAGTPLTKRNLLTARTRLTTARAPGVQGERFAIIPTKDLEYILDDLSTTPAGAMMGQDGELRNAEVGRLYGFNLFETNMAPEVAGTPPITHSLAMHRDALTMVTRPLKLPTRGAGVVASNIYDDVTGITVRVMLSYDHAMMCERVTYDILMGAKMMRPDFAVDLQS